MNKIYLDDLAFKAVKVEAALTGEKLKNAASRLILSSISLKTKNALASLIDQEDQIDQIDQKDPFCETAGEEVEPVQIVPPAQAAPKSQTLAALVTSENEKREVAFLAAWSKGLRSVKELEDETGIPHTTTQRLKKRLLAAGKITP